MTVAGGHGEGNATNQFFWPHGLDIDNENQTIIIADWYNDRVVQWKVSEKNGQVVAGGRGEGNRLDQLNGPTDVLIDKGTDSLLICDRDNRRVLQWFRHHGTSQKVILNDICCRALVMDDQRYLYVSDHEKNEVRRYAMNDKNGTLVAGGHGRGDGLHQLNCPTYLFVDREQAIYVSDKNNHRVMKWSKGAKKGTVVAGGHGQGSTLQQLSCPNGLFVDTLGTVYVVDYSNHRVMRWPVETQVGTVVVGGNGRGQGANQLHRPKDLTFDRHGNLYVVDGRNNRVQRFSIK